MAAAVAGAAQAGGRAHDLPDQPDGRRCCGRPGSRCTATSTGRARARRARRAPAAGVDEPLPEAARRRSPTRRTTRRGGCSPTPASPSRPRARCTDRDGARGGPRPRTGLPARAQGHWVGCTSPRAGEWCSGWPRRATPLGGVRRPGGAARPAGRLRRGDGRPRRGRRADRGCVRDRDVRAGAHGRARRGPRRGARRHRLRARAGVGRRRPASCCCRCAVRRCCSARGAARRSTSTRSPSVVARSRALAAAHPELAELELNPVLAGPPASLALDARVVLGSGSVARRRAGSARRSRAPRRPWPGTRRGRRRVR